MRLQVSVETFRHAMSGVEIRWTVDNYVTGKSSSYAKVIGEYDDLNSAYDYIWERAQKLVRAELESLRDKREGGEK